MSASQLVFLTSLVAIIRGLFTFRPEKKTRNRIAGLIDVLLLGAVAYGVIYYFKHRDEVAFYLNREMVREWLQNNVGTFVFGLASLVLIIAFRVALSKEWDAPFLKGVFEWLDPFMMAGTIALILITYFVRTYYIPSESMEPTLLVHDYIIVAKPFLLRLFHDYPPVRGDIVVFHPPLPGETREYIKRVVGLPGESLFVHDEKVFINGKPLSEPYVKAPPDYQFGPLSIPQNNYIVFGDNRRNSEDSHAWREAGGEPFLDVKEIEGRAVLIFLPLGRVRILHD